MRIGAHVPADDPLAAAAARDAEVIQIFLGPPQSYRKPPPRDDAATLRTADLPIYVHAPYPINVASLSPRIRHPGRKTLQDALDAAADIGARGVIVHGGHLEVDEDPALGIRNWRKALESVSSPVPVLIENTAGGDNAMARHVDAIARLWDAISGVEQPFGFCLDTCHLHAAGEDLVTGVERLRDIVGAIDLVHCNDSRDEAGSARDRHTNLGTGLIDPDALVAAVLAADADVVVETPDGEDGTGQAGDIAWLRERLGSA